MDRDVNEEMYKKILLLMALDSGYEKDFAKRYVPQEVFDELLIKAKVGAPDMKYIQDALEQQMDQLIAELQTEINPN